MRIQELEQMRFKAAVLNEVGRPLEIDELEPVRPA